MDRRKMLRSTTTTSLRSHTAVASGYLHKLTHNGTPFARWHQRYYVLYSDGVLRSFKSSRASNSYRVIHVGRKCLRLRFGDETRANDCSRWPKNSSSALRFSVINVDREYHFYCESEQEFATWRDSLQRILVKLGSSHSSYVQRRSRVNGDLFAQQQIKDEGAERDSSASPTPLGGSQGKSSKQRIVANLRREKGGNRTRGKDAGIGEAYDAFGPAIPYTNLDDDEEDEEEDEEENYKPEALSQNAQQWNGYKSRNERAKFEGVSNPRTIQLLRTAGAEEEEDEDKFSSEDINESTIGSKYASARENDGKINKDSSPPTNGIEAAFLQVQAIIDETFNNIC